MKIDVSKIIVAHVRTLRNNSTKKYSAADIVVFGIAPLAISVLAPYFGWKFSADVLNALLTAFSIFAGLLLNLLILIYTFSADTEHPTALAKVRKIVVKELHNNIAYSILVSIIIVLVAVLAVAYLKMHEVPGQTQFTSLWVTGLVIFLTTNFVLTMLMVLKRIYLMLDQTIDRPFVAKKSA